MFNYLQLLEIHLDSKVEVDPQVLPHQMDLIHQANIGLLVEVEDQVTIQDQIQEEVVDHHLLMAHHGLVVEQVVKEIILHSVIQNDLENLVKLTLVAVEVLVLEVVLDQSDPVVLVSFSSHTQPDKYLKT